MRLSTKHFLRSKVEKKIARSVEGRPGIVVSVDVPNRKALVRIQGTDVEISVPWQQNWTEVPSFVYVGNSVLIGHIIGNPNKLELIDDGISIPTPVGSGSILPDQPASDDIVISGMAVTIAGGLDVDIATGTYRIDTSIYTFETPDTVTVDTAPSSPNYRVDLICVGADGILDYIAGTPHASAPVTPSLPSSHASVTTIIVPYETTELEQKFIGDAWSEPTLAAFALSIATEIRWTDSVQVTGTITLVNQYGKQHNDAYNITATIKDGNGILEETGSPFTTGTTIDWDITTGSTTFVYERGKIDNIDIFGSPVDSSPTINVYITTATDFYSVAFISLYNSLDDFML
jgi:hypothetical protein